MTEELQDTPRRRGRPPNAIRNQIREPARGNIREGSTYTGRDGEILSRSRRSGTDPFDVPQNFVPTGWEYQWCAVSSYGNTEIMRTLLTEFEQNGWRPVQYERHDGFFAQKGKSGAIIVRGQMLMERPKQMCDDARDEDERNARQQMRDRDQALMGGKANLRGATSGQGIPVRGTGDHQGNAIRMSIDPALDAPSSNYQIAEGE